MWRENLENHSVDVKSVDALGFGIPGNLGRAHNRNPMDFCCLFPKSKALCWRPSFSYLCWRTYCLGPVRDSFFFLNKGKQDQT